MRTGKGQFGETPRGWQQGRRDLDLNPSSVLFYEVLWLEGLRKRPRGTAKFHLPTFLLTGTQSCLALYRHTELNHRGLDEEPAQREHMSKNNTQHNGTFSTPASG